MLSAAAVAAKPPPAASSSHTIPYTTSLPIYRFMAKNAAGRSLESILQAVKHDYCFEPFTAEDKPQNKNEIKAQLLRFAVKFYHQIRHTRAADRKEALNSRHEKSLTC